MQANRIFTAILEALALRSIYDATISLYSSSVISKLFFRFCYLSTMPIIADGKAPQKERGHLLSQQACSDSLPNHDKEAPYADIAERRR